MHPSFAEPNPENQFLSEHIQLLQSSFLRLTGKQLSAPGFPSDPTPEAFYHAPFVLLSHDTSTDPIFTYGNLCAQNLFEFSWAELTQLPSRFSAELPNREERARLLALVTQNGFIDNYEGVRVSKTGKRFLVSGATVWNLIDAHGTYHGQAATFRSWQPLPEC